MSLKHYLQLIRAPNAFTAATNVFTGCAAVSGPAGIPISNLLLLAASSVALYAGGIALNDYCDLETDRRERPQRPLPSGKIPPPRALAIAIGLLAGGILTAGLVHPIGLLVATAIALLITTYDGWSKSIPLLGPLNMGACRFGNVLLGSCIAPAASLNALPFALVMMSWVVVISILSQREALQPRLQTVVKLMLLAIPLIDGLFVGALAGPEFGLVVALFALPAWFLSRWLYMT